MRRVLLLAVFGLAWWPGVARAQSSLSGVVQDSVTHAPLAFASVFLANTTLGVTTTEQGTFVFPKVPAGTYDVVGSYVGYRLAKQTVTVGTSPQQLTLRLGTATSRLGEVVVRPNPNRASDYQKFVELFLGRSTFSQRCRIRNPDEVVVDFDAETSELTASSYKFVQVDNQALGYRIKYYGLHFVCNFRQHVVSFYGQPVFEEMTGSAGQQRRWAANRMKAYNGSLAHFLRSVHDGDIAAAGFVAQRLRIIPNKRFLRADSLRRQLLRERRNMALSRAEQDSISYWAKVPQAFSMLYAKPRPLDSLRRVTPDGQHVFLRFIDNLQVSYVREGPDPLYQLRTTLPTNAPLPPSDRQVSQLVLMVPEIEIQPNGQLANPLAVYTDEYWGFEKMGEFLPVNYLPPASAASPSSPTR
ncbi:carboxypeptidase-like regulatory domain-containing protein [Hymenobacter sp. 5317J-9]|uniref:carboxypeptidase-like regulatory domain-containing protein n=1 Tax=Hymenobacter sp. 5317J-9 TaxID=2932250 RepID=UPI001FD6A9D5|nr:carboxypeptidase-like regulatory domain-containing protein [Hymenobacter sp. 5317J-9]UOQ99298.1 carboxypeptidase-like regulatory domain-containing protein [Hymenobacter sp. 5317J-9]